MISECQKTLLVLFLSAMSGTQSLCCVTFPTMRPTFKTRSVSNSAKFRCKKIMIFCVRYASVNTLKASLLAYQTADMDSAGTATLATSQAKLAMEKAPSKQSARTRTAV